ncbi:MAG: uracil-DNA glycosylase [Clostridiales bacterium]|nr:uracil-DNA glycosylase [Clostridiales bacterium]
MLHEQIFACEKCPLGKTSIKKVPGQGSGSSPLMLVGEGPGQQEDRTGIAFIGPAGQLLTKMLQSIGVDRKKVYITNIVKCRPPGNRLPNGQEQKACMDYLRMQVALVKPKVILLLGAAATQGILGEDFRITKDHGKWVQRKNTLFLPTFHPSALLRDESKKPAAWKDLQILQKYLEDEKMISKIQYTESEKHG